MSARRRPTILLWRLAPEPTHDGHLVAKLWRVPESVAFHLDYEVGELMRAIEQKLMRHAGRNADNVSGRAFVPTAALDVAIAVFMRRNRSPLSGSLARANRSALVKRRPDSSSLGCG
jgi:hypothetical protein